MVFGGTTSFWTRCFSQVPSSAWVLLKSVAKSFDWSDVKDKSLEKALLGLRGFITGWIVTDNFIPGQTESKWKLGVKQSFIHAH